MQPDRVIVCTNRHSDGISTRPDNPNNLTCQSSSTNDAPRYPYYSTVTQNTARTRPKSTLRLHLRPQYWHSAYVMITMRNPPLCQYPIHCRVINLMLVPSLASEVPRWLLFPTWFGSPFLTWFNSRFSTWFDSRFLTGFDSVFYLIWLMFDTLVFDLSHIIRVLFQRGFIKSNNSRVSWK